MKDMEFINAYRTMRSCGDICNDLRIDFANLINDKVADEKLKKIVYQMRVEIMKMSGLLKIYDEGE